VTDPSRPRRAVTPPGAAPDARPLTAALLAAAARSPTAPVSAEATLRAVVQAAVDHVDATYGALGVLSPDGARLDHFVVVGVDDEQREAIGRLPEGRGVLGLLVEHPEVLRIRDLRAHPASVGFPPGHPEMRSFLGLPVRVGNAVFGNLYLTGKRSGGEFTEADAEAVQALAAVAGLAIENARLAERAEQRRAWLQAATEVATALLSGTDPGDALRSVAASVRALTSADLTGVLVPTQGDDSTLTIAAAVGPGAADIEGVRVPLTATHVGEVHRSGTPALVADTGTDPVLEGHAEVAVEITRSLGPGLLVPLGGPPPLAMVVALRRRGREQFPADVLEPVTAFAAQTAVALTLARSQARERRLQVQADRDRIARDLHDHVVQRIFATALSLDRVARSLEDRHPEAAVRIAGAVDELDATIAEIRATIFELHHEDDRHPDGLRRSVADVVRRVTEGRALRRDVRVRGPVEDLPAHLVPDLVAVVRELVTNVVRHAGARRVTVTLTADDDGVRVVVTDDGRGLDPAAARSGLANLADRAERRGGRLTVPPRASGTQVRWSVPRP
jgi:signal transduction histidine kinase